MVHPLAHVEVATQEAVHIVVTMALGVLITIAVWPAVAVVVVHLGYSARAQRNVFCQDQHQMVRPLMAHVRVEEIATEHATMAIGAAPITDAKISNTLLIFNIDSGGNAFRTDVKGEVC